MALGTPKKKYVSTREKERENEKQNRVEQQVKRKTNRPPFKSNLLAQSRAKTNRIAKRGKCLFGRLVSAFSFIQIEYLIESCYTFFIASNWANTLHCHPKCILFLKQIFMPSLMNVYARGCVHLCMSAKQANVDMHRMHNGAHMIYSTATSHSVIRSCSTSTCTHINCINW